VARRARRHGGCTARHTHGVGKRTLTARVVLAGLAVPLIVWFALLARNHAIATDAVDRVVADPGMSAAEWDRAMDDLRRAELLDPGSDWRMIRALYLLLRDRRAALRLANAALRSEPDNLSAWWVVVRAARDLDPARWREAIAQVRRLNPPPKPR
jgi:hypothetical protein